MITNIDELYSLSCNYLFYINFFTSNTIIMVNIMFKIFMIGFIFISIVGTILHFTYEITNKNKFIALFSATNESTWEHIKMGLSALLFYSIIDYSLIGNNPNYFFSKLVSIISLIILIPLIFYSYTKISKKPILFVDILSFYISILISQLFGYWVVNLNVNSQSLSIIFKSMLFTIFIFYLTATFYPPKSKLFLDPITKKYGPNK